MSSHIIHSFLGPYVNRSAALEDAATKVNLAIKARDPSGYFAAADVEAMHVPSLSIASLTAFDMYLQGMRSNLRPVIQGLRYVNKAAELVQVHSLSALVAAFIADLETEETIWWYTPLLPRMEAIAAAIDDFITSARRIDPTDLYSKISWVTAFEAVTTYAVPVHTAWLAKIFGWDVQIKNGTKFSTVEIMPVSFERAFTNATLSLPTVGPEAAGLVVTILDGLLANLLFPDFEETTMTAFTFLDTKTMYSGGYRHDFGATENANAIRRSVFTLFFSCIKHLPLVAFSAISNLSSYRKE